MSMEISQNLTSQLKKILETAYAEHFSHEKEYIALNEKISSELGVFYLKASMELVTKDVRVFPFELGGERFVGYLLWSEDLNLPGAESSHFFLLLTGFGFVSGIEITATGQTRRTLWQDLLGEKAPEAIFESLSDLHLKADFTADSQLIRKYLELLEQASK